MGIKENNLKLRNIQNFELNIQSSHREDYNLDDDEKSRLGFYITAISNIVEVNESEILDCITDTKFNEYITGKKENDMGIDAVYIDEEEKIISLFAFKYRKTANKGAQGNEMLEKLQVGLMPFRTFKKYEGKKLKGTKKKTNEILEILGNSPDWIINFYLVSNEIKISNSSETGKYLKELVDELDIEFVSIGFDEIYNRVFSNSIKHDCKLMVPDKSLIEGVIEGNSDKYYIVDVPITTLLRMCFKDSEAANDVSIEKLGEYLDSNHKTEFNYVVLEENVRGYLGTGRSKYNKQIKQTIEREPENFILYNNGITILCEKIHYQSTKHTPNSVLTLSNMSIVNGGQTARVIHEYFCENDLTEEFMNNLSKVKVQIKLNEISSAKIKDKISEYTNSQNAIKSKDLHSNDSVQKEIERHLKMKDIFYQRKSGMYTQGSYTNKIEMEDFGQFIYSVMGYPHASVNKKKVIFEEKYHDIFSTEKLGDDILTQYAETLIRLNLFKRDKKKLKKQEKQYVAYALLNSSENNIDICLQKYSDLREMYIVRDRIDRPEITNDFFEDYKLYLKDELEGITSEFN